MNHEKLHEQIHLGVDRQCASLTSDPYRVQRVLNAAQPKGDKIVVRRIPRIVVVLAVMLVLGISTAIAAGVAYWNRGLEDMLQVTEETKEYYMHTDLFGEPGMSVTQGDVTVTLEQSIVDTNVAYLAFRVTGWQPEEGQQPDFAAVDISDNQNQLFSCSTGFFDGLAEDSEGSAASYVDENGEMVYTVRLFSDVDEIIGNTLNVTLTDLGVRTSDESGVQVKAPGTWHFKWELTGTDHTWKFRGLALDVGTKGATITSIQLSPIHIRVVMNVDLPYLDFRNRSDGSDFIPQFYGLKMKDGTVYEGVADVGYGGYDSPDPDGRVYQMLYSLNRVIEPAKVDYLLFLCSDGEGGQELAEVKFN